MENTRKYLLSGHEVEVIEKTQLGFIVVNVYEDNDGEELMDGERYFVENVYDDPPLGKLNTQVSALREEVQSLYAEKKALTQEIKEARQQGDSLLKKFKQHKQLKQLEDFIDGKITHYVVLGYRYEIMEFKESVSEHAKDQLKLLSLFGNTKGDLSWRLNSYSDGSGGYSDVYPCTSYEQALEKMQEFINERTKTDKHTDYRLIETAKKYNLTIDPEYTKRHHEQSRKNLEDRLKERKEDIQKIEKQLSELPE